MKIAVASDHRGFEAKEQVKAQVAQMGHECLDYGTTSNNPVDYPDLAYVAAKAVSGHEVDRAILICGTGIGMCITANKVPGIRAALAHDVYSAERARKSNNAQILTLGAVVIGPEAAKKIVEAWLPSDFVGGRSARKVAKIDAVDRRYRA